jgi:hypothetical protein
VGSLSRGNAARNGSRKGKAELPAIDMALRDDNLRADGKKC